MLADHQDAYGREILDYFEGRGGFEVVERDDGYIDISGGPQSYFAPYDEWPAHQQRGMDFVRGRVLDIGCGAGRVALHLQSLDLDVTGIDISPRAIEVCRRRGVEQVQVLSITQLSSKTGQFDTLVMYGNNFGLFGNFRRARWLLRRFYAMSGSRARIVAESLDPYQTENPFHLSYHALNLKRGRMAGQVRIRIRYQKYRSPWFDYLFVSRDEMKSILQDTGWQVHEFIDPHGSPYVAIIEKIER